MVTKRQRGTSKPKSSPEKGVDRMELTGAIEMIMPGIAKSKLVEQFGLVLFNDTRIKSYNDEVAVSVPLKTGIVGGVQAEKLYQFLKKIDSARVEIETVGNEIKFVAGKVKAGLKVIEEVDIPDLGIDAMEKKNWKKLPENFVEAMGFCLFSASTDIGKGIFTCLYATGGSMVSCDNFRLTKFELSSEVEEELVVPRKSAVALVDYNPTQAGFSSANSWVHFQNEQKVVFSTRYISDETYPDIEGIINVDGETAEFTNDIKKTMELAEIFADGDASFQKVTVTLKKNKVVCRAEGDAGWVEESLKIKYDGSDVTPFDVTPAFLKQIIERTKTVTVGKTLAFEGEGFVHIITILAA